jgi:hypothetical protein
MESRRHFFYMLLSQESVSDRAVLWYVIHFNPEIGGKARTRLRRRWGSESGGQIALFIYSTLSKSRPQCVHTTFASRFPSRRSLLWMRKFLCLIFFRSMLDIMSPDAFLSTLLQRLYTHSRVDDTTILSLSSRLLNIFISYSFP